MIAFLGIALTFGLTWLVRQLRGGRVGRVFTVCLLAIAGVWAFGKLTGHFPGPIYDHFIRAVFQPEGDGSISYRSLRVKAAFDVFKESPWFGVGPGGAGAYLVEHFPNHPVFFGRFAVEAQGYRSDPLAMSYYLELLTDWGILGSLFFIAGLGLWFGAFGRFERLLIFGCLAVIAITGQTLQRFDFWWLMALLQCSTGVQRWIPEVTKEKH
jgi:O-antigen ligase